MVQVCLCLWPVHFTCASLSPPLLGEAERLDWAAVGHFPSLCRTLEQAGVGYSPPSWEMARVSWCWSFPFPRFVVFWQTPMGRLWFNSFTWGQNLSRTDRPGVFQSGSFSLLPGGRTRVIFSYIHWENLVKLIAIKLTTGWGPLNDWVPLDYFFLTRLHWPPSNLSIAVGVFLLWHRLLQRSLLWWVVIICLHLLALPVWRAAVYPFNY